jgi:serine/threonine-protein kinase
MGYHLKLIGKATKGFVVKEGDIVLIGRSSETDFRIADHLVSRKHCRIGLGAEGFWVEDLGSRNGTYLNGKRIKKAPLRKDDILKIGPDKLKVRILSEEEMGAGSVKCRSCGVLYSRDELEDFDYCPQCGDKLLLAAPADEPSIAPSAGDLWDYDKIKGYKILKKLKRGRPETIFLAKREEDNRKVALKILDTSTVKNPKNVQRFLREAEALSKLDHPNIVRVLDISKEGALRYYAMEYVEGISLAERLKREERLEVREAVGIALRVARALDAAFKKGVIHRDINPENIIVGFGGVAKLCDFGLAKNFSREDSGAITGLGEMVGDPRYISQEQLQDPSRVDHRADIYSLGATLFHLLAGRPPFEGRNPLEIIRKMLGSEAEALSDINPDVPDSIERIVKKCLSKNPEDRYQTPAELVRSLEEALVKVCGPKHEAGKTGLSGNFLDTELMEILQFLEFNKKEGVLVIRSGAFEGKIQFRSGLIVGAETAVLEGREAVLELLALPGGSFDFRVTQVKPKDRIGIIPSAVVLDALRIRDEGRKITTKLKKGDTGAIEVDSEM